MLFRSVKSKAEIWKREVFADGAAEWRANTAPPGEGSLAPIEGAGGARNAEGDGGSENGEG